MAGVCILAAVSWILSGVHLKIWAVMTPWQAHLWPRLELLLDYYIDCHRGVHDPNSSRAHVAATTITFVPNITSSEAHTTCSTLGLDVDASANHKSTR
jgi:di/tricarboxylate transporter